MKNIMLLFLWIILNSGISFAQLRLNVRGQNMLSNLFSFNAEGGLTIGFTDYKSAKLSVIGFGSVGYYFPSTSRSIFGVRVFVSKGYVDGEDSRKSITEFSTKIAQLGANFVYALEINKKFIPYWCIGLSSTWFSPKDINGNKMPGYYYNAYKTQMVTYNNELGVKMVVSDRLSVNINFALDIAGKDYLDDLKAGASIDMFYTIKTGISYYLAIKNDSDNDGVDDKEDICLNTPSGIKVDEFGCPLDHDEDGVPDYLDKCPGTAKGVRVDSTGCRVKK